MANIIRAALLQTDWTGDKESMIVKHEDAAREAAADGAQIICFQELFYGPYFCQVQDPEYYEYTEYIPDGPTTKRFQALAKELQMVTRVLFAMVVCLTVGAPQTPSAQTPAAPV